MQCPPSLCVQSPSLEHAIGIPFSSTPSEELVSPTEDIGALEENASLREDVGELEEDDDDDWPLETPPNRAIARKRMNPNSSAATNPRHAPAKKMDWSRYGHPLPSPSSGTGLHSPASSSSCCIVRHYPHFHGPLAMNAHHNTGPRSHTEYQSPPVRSRCRVAASHYECSGRKREPRACIQEHAQENARRECCKRNARMINFGLE